MKPDFLPKQFFPFPRYKMHLFIFPLIYARTFAHVKFMNTFVFLCPTLFPNAPIVPAMFLLPLHVHPRFSVLFAYLSRSLLCSPVFLCHFHYRLFPALRPVRQENTPSHHSCQKANENYPGIFAKYLSFQTTPSFCIQQPVEKSSRRPLHIIIKSFYP